jgi:predicted enzyme related to lactoylglutathione lyase
MRSRWAPTVTCMARTRIRRVTWSVFTSDDIRADWKRLTDAGVVFVEDPKDYGNVSVATFKDPDGNLLQLLQFHRP